jgi:hypothetical protein
MEQILSKELEKHCYELKQKVAELLFAFHIETGLSPNIECVSTTTRDGYGKEKLLKTETKLLFTL